MMDNNLTILIENIEDKLTKYCSDIINPIDVGKAGITSFVIAPADKVYPLTATTEDILNDPENIVVNVVPKYRPIFKGSVCILPEKTLNDLLPKMQIGSNTIRNIKNNLASLSYTDKQISVDVVKNELIDKIQTLEALKYALERSIICHPEIRQWSAELLEKLIQLLDRINKIKVDIQRTEATETLKSSTDNPNTETPRYSFSTSKITEIYNFCTDTEVLQNAVISNVDFINAVNVANFKAIYDHAQQRKSKSKCKYIIFILNKFVTGDGWYLNTARSINTEPTKCSGINVPPEWKKRADAIK
jgi:hypothetical protein